MALDWKPAVSGALAQRALDAAAQVVEALKPFAGRKGTDAGLFAGQAGLALFFQAAERAGLTPDATLSEACLEMCLDAAANDPLDATFECGLAGIGFALEQITGDPDASDSVDEVLEEHLSGPVSPVLPDFLNGLVGYGAYAAGRGEKGAGILAHVLRHLESFWVREGESIHLRLQGDALGKAWRAKWPAGLERLGLAHGAAGVVSLLALAAPASTAAAALLEPTLRGLLSAADPVTHAFADAISGAERVKMTTYDAWCNGTPGVAASISWALQGRLEDASLVSRARSILSAAVRARPVPEDGLVCHGTAGIGSIFLRVHQRTPSSHTEAAARHWVEATLQHLRPDGLGGFLAHRPWLPETPWVSDPGLGTGSAGAAAFLLAAATRNEPSWDRALMLS